MPGKLRVFISSTMEDLESERDMVVYRLKEFNFEPVNAEAMLPNGATSWDRISEEIETCDAFVLLSGVRYGWIPTSGPLAPEKISVTHGEYRAARRREMPILPFFKVLKYGADASSDDARRRDAFRKEVGDWDKGGFRTDFTTARDLGDKAASSIMGMLSDHFQRALIAKSRAATPLIPSVPIVPVDKQALPHGLVSAVEQGRALLWAGSGFSLRAGLPSAGALAADMTRLIAESIGGYAPPAVGSGVASVASDFEMEFQRPTLLAKLSEWLNPPGGVTPSPEHGAAVALFPRIITTNYDRLFESAAAIAGTGHATIAGPRLPSPVPDKFIWKIHGASDLPEFLVVTEADIATFESFTSELVEGLRQILSGGALLVGGTTLRDPSILRLFRDLKGNFEGYWSVPPGDKLAVRRAADLGMHSIEALLESVIAALR